jgi:hypothetical protein
MEWSSQSPDLNPNENLWEEVDRRCKGRKPRNQNDLFQVLKEELGNKYRHPPWSNWWTPCPAAVRP